MKLYCINNCYCHISSCNKVAILLQIHGSRDSVANVDLEGASTSLAQSEAVATHNTEDGTVGEVQVVQYQPAEVEYHETPANLVSDDSAEDDPMVERPHSKRNKVAPALSMESMRSQDSDSNELQKLMPPMVHRDNNGTRRESESSWWLRVWTGSELELAMALSFLLDN